MLRGRMPSNKLFGRIALFFAISAIFLTITAAGANAAGFSFMDSVKEFFGFATVQAVAPQDQAAEPNSAPEMEPQPMFGIDPPILTWSTFGNAGTETTEPSTFNHANVGAASLTLGTITPAANGSRFGGSGWFNTGNTAAGNTLAEAVAGNDYIQFIVTPNAGFAFTPTSLVFQWDRSATGPQHVTLRSSADGYSTDLGTVTGMASGASNIVRTIDISGLTTLSTATTFRLYGYGATATAGTGGYDTGTNATNVALNGIITNIADYCALQFPTSLNLSSGANTGAIYGRIFEGGVTEPAGGSATVTGQLGFGPHLSNPAVAGGWSWVSSAFNIQIGNDDEYQAGFTAPVVPSTTQFSYTYRFSFDSGTTWTYCDINGNGSNAGLSFDVNQLGVLTVQPVQHTLTVALAGTGTGQVTSNPIGISCGADCTENYDSGTPVQLTAIGFVGSTFAGWSGDCAGQSAVCSVAMDAAKSATAIFTRNNYTLSVSKGGGGGGGGGGAGYDGLVTSQPAGISCGLTCSAGYDHGTVVSLLAEPDSTSRFAGWSGDCSCTGATCDVTMSSAKSCTATFGPPNVVISSSGTLQGGTYHDVSFAGGTCSTATMSGDVTITGTMTVGSCNTLDTNHHRVLGSGSFVLGDGGAMTVGDPYGITTPFSTVSCPVGADCGSVQTSSRSFSSLADYTYNGLTNQIVGNALPSSVHNLYVVSPPSALTDTRLDGYSPQTVTGTLQITGSSSSSKKEFKGHVTLLKRGTGTCDGEIDVYNNVVIDAHGKLTLGCDVIVTGDWTMAPGGELSGEHPVTLQGTTEQHITGDTTFYKLQSGFIYATSPSSQGPARISGQITVTDELVLHGSPGSLLTFSGVDGGTGTPSPWSLCATGTRSVHHVSVSDSDATCSGAPVVATSSQNGGSNQNWFFGEMLTVATSGPGSGRVTSQPIGITCPGDCSETYDQGTVVTLTATADPGSTFTGWTGEPCAGLPENCNVSMSQARSVSATFGHNDLVVTGPATPLSGTYHDVTFSSCGSAFLASDVVITGSMTVSSCSSLETNGHRVLGSGSFVLADGGMLYISDPYGITTPFSTVSCPAGGADCGSIQTSSRSFSSLADYTYNGVTDQIVGNALPSSVRNLYIVSSPSALSSTRVDGYSPQVVTGELHITGSSSSSKKEFKGHVTLLKRGTGTCDGEIDVYNDVVIDAHGKLTLGCDVIVTGDFTKAPLGELSGDYAVTLNGSTGEQVVTGDITFYKLQSGFIYATSPSPVPLRMHGTMTISNKIVMYGGQSDMLSISGTGGGSGTPNSPWSMCATGERDIHHVSVSDSDATCSGAPVVASHSTDGGSNVNWLFGETLSVTKDGSGTGLVRSIPNGIDCGSTCSSVFSSGQVVRLDATSSSDSSFTSWGGACTGTSPTCMVTMDQAKDVTATFTARDLVIPSNTFIAGGTYRNVSFGGCFTATMDGDVTITGTMTVGSCATLDTNHHRVLGSGSFVLGDGGAMTVGDPYGITTPFSTVSCPVGADCGSVQTSSRSFSSLADYTYNGLTNQIVGNALPSSVHNLYVVSPPSALTDTRVDGYSPQTVTGELHITGSSSSSKKEFKGHVTLLKRGTGTCDGEIDVYNNVVIDAHGKLTLGCDVIVTGDWTMAPGGELSGEHPVTLQGTTEQHITGDTTFYKLQSGFIYATSPSSQGPARISGQITVTDELVLHGAPGSLLTIGGSGTAGSHWELCALGTRSVDYVTMSDADATCSGAPVRATNSMDGGGNLNVLFNPRELSVTKLGSGQGTVTSQPQGISCGTQCSAEFTQGSTVRLVAAALLGSRFESWSGACSGTSPMCDVTMDAAKAVSVTFVVDATPPTVSITSTDPNPTTGGTTVTFSSSEDGAYSIRVGGDDCDDGEEVATGVWASAGSLSRSVSEHSLYRGSNTVRVCVTDAAGNTGSSSTTVQQQSCVAPNLGFETGDIPEECRLLSGEMQATDGLPPGEPIRIRGSLQDPTDVTSSPGGSLGGDQVSATMHWVLEVRVQNIKMARTMPNVPIVIHNGPRTLGDPVQSFDTSMFALSGQLPPGDPDFDLLRITAGSSFGLPSPGHTTLTRVPGTNSWSVDSFFDVTYRIDFVGKPGGALGGMSGSTTGTIRMHKGWRPPPLSQCSSPDDGTGTSELPADCPAQGWPVSIIDGLPSGAAMLSDIVFSDSSSGASTSGGTLGGTVHPFVWSGMLHMQGTGDPDFDLLRTIPLSSCPGTIHAAPRSPGQPVQSFDTEMFALQCQVTGDPDFDLLRITAGSSFGLPSPGHTTLRINPNDSWDVDSFFDITYRIEFTGRPGGRFGGRSGSTTGTIRMSQGIPQHTLIVTKGGGGGGTVTSSPAGIDCGSDCSEDFAEGTMVTLTAVPDASSSFAGWTGDCSGTDECTVTMDQARNVVATFHHMHQLAVSKVGTGNGLVRSIPLGINCGTTCSSSFPEGTLVTLTATPAPSSNFAGWSGACDGTSPQCVVTMDQARSVTATFMLKSSDASLSSLTTSDGPPLSPVFSSSTFAYTQYVLSSTSSMSVTPTCSSGACSSITVNDIPVSSGSPSSSISVAVGTTVVTVRVTAEDGITEGVYTITITRGRASSCVAPDNGTDSVDLPAPCRYFGGPVSISSGLPPPSSLDSAMSFDSFADVVRTPGGPLGGEVDTFHGTMSLQMNGSGAMSSFHRLITIPNAEAEFHHGPRQTTSFSSRVHSMMGQLPPGDPDFDLLRVTAGSSVAFAQPGMCSSSRVVGTSSFTVECVYNVPVMVEFQGKSGGPLSGMSGSTTGTIRMTQSSSEPHPPTQCLMADNGTGTADFPASCSYDGWPVSMISGMPQGTSVQADWSFYDFSSVSTAPGGTLGGQRTGYAAYAALAMEVTGTVSAGASPRKITCPPGMMVVDTAPRSSGQPVQSFETSLISYQCEIPPGDPDFDLLRITAGSQFGLPSPGHTTLTLSGGQWNVDSFFDVTYQIEYVGKSGGPFGGMSGSTTGTIRMQQGVTVEAPTPTSTSTPTNTATPTATATATYTPTPSVDFCQQLIAAGQAAVCSTGGDATTGDNAVTHVTVPAGAAPSSFVLTVTETNNPSSPPGFTALGQSVHIDGQGVTLSSPATVIFEVDSSLMSGVDLGRVGMFRDGLRLQACSSGADPCVVSVTLDAQGDGLFCGQTSHFSEWVIAEEDPATVSGTVTYGNAVAPGPPTRFVPGVLLSAVGSPSVSNTTDSSGTYLLSGFGAGSYTITPSKSGGANGAVTSFDAARIAQFAVGAIGLSSAQQSAADVSGVGGITSFDASLIARYVASLGPPMGSTGTWTFSPTSNTHASITSSIADENYTALLKGDVTGNWGDPLPFRPAFGPERSTAVSAPSVVAVPGGGFVVPITVEGAAGKGIISYQFDLRYDPAVMQPAEIAADVAETVSRGFTTVFNAEQPGLLRVVVYGPMPIDGSGILLNLRFFAIGEIGSLSPLMWENIMFNEGDPHVVAVDGQVEISTAIAD